MQLFTIPKLIGVEEFAEQAGLSRYCAYDMVRKMPKGVVVRLGRRVRLDADRLREWLNAGGTHA